VNYQDSQCFSSYFQLIPAIHFMFSIKHHKTMSAAPRLPVLAGVFGLVALMAVGSESGFR